MELTKKQEEGLNIALTRYKAGEKFTVISGYAGSGKAQPIDTIIPTPAGDKELGKIQVGDYVFDRTGNPTKVLGIYPQGSKEKYKIVLSDGRETICANDHLWSYYTSRGKLASKTTQEMLNGGLKNVSGFKYKIPTNEPIQYSTKEYTVDPYLMGAFLGDGCCKERYLTLSSETEEIPNLIGEIINAKPIRNSETNYNWSFEWNDETKTVSWIGGQGVSRTAEKKKPKTLDYFEKYQEYLMQYAYEKDIPPEYKYGNIEQRLALIQGLMDTDGSINSTDNHRYNMRFTSTSLKLVKSLQEILFGLGYSSTIHTDERKEKYTNNICYNLSINIPNEEKYKFFKLKRKKDIALEAQKYKKRKDYNKISIVDIIPLEEMTEMVCIYVDNPEHLYLTNDCIVTHNTTLVKFIIDALDVDKDKVAYATFTGKAAEVLRKKGNENAMTLHRLLYDSIPRAGGGFIRKPKPILEYTVIVVDEVSMVPKSMIDMLLSHKVYVLFLGDPFQLPVIDKDQAHDLLDHPHIFLDEIMRQAAESEIIQLTMKIRNGESLDCFKGNEVQVLEKGSLNTGMLTWADQIICATNASRISLNNQMRNLLGYSGEIQDGEKVIIKRNYWEDCNEDGDALVNGSTGIIRNPFESFRRIPNYIKNNRHDLPIIIGDFIPECGKEFQGIEFDRDFITKEEPCVDWRVSYQLGKLKNKIGDIIPRQMTYGYAITCHAAQGSEWDKVLVVEERFPFDKKEHARWLYTAATRSAKKLVLIRG